jgi:hypothetical protein
MKQSKLAIVVVILAVIAVIIIVIAMLASASGRQPVSTNSQLAAQEEIQGNDSDVVDARTESQLGTPVDSQVSSADDVLNSIDAVLNTPDSSFNDSDIKELE